MELTVTIISMETYLVMIEIATFNKQIKTYYLLKSDTIKKAQAIIDKYLRDNGSTKKEFDYSLTSVEKLCINEVLILERYIDYFK